MYKYVFIITILINLPSWGQQATVYEETETCHNYSEYFYYTNYNNGQYDEKSLEKSKTRDESQRTVIKQGNDITIIEKRKSYDTDGELAFTYSYNYEIKRMFLEENKYKDEIEYTRTVYIGDNSKDSITHEGIRETKIYQLHPGGSKELIKHLADDGTELEVEENLEYTKPDGTKYKVTLSDEKRVSKSDDSRIDTLFEMKVCNSQKL